MEEGDSPLNLVGVAVGQEGLQVEKEEGNVHILLDQEAVMGQEAGVSFLMVGQVNSLLQLEVVDHDLRVEEGAETHSAHAVEVAVLQIELEVAEVRSLERSLWVSQEKMGDL